MEKSKKMGTLNGDTKKGHKNDELFSVVEMLVGEVLKNEKTKWEQEFSERINYEREDAARLATMSADERARAEIEKKQQAFEAERKQYVSERAEFEAARELASQKLPVNFAAMVANPDREKMAENIALLKAEYMQAIEEGLSQRLRGSSPKISRETDMDFDPFLNGLGI